MLKSRIYLFKSNFKKTFFFFMDFLGYLFFLPLRIIKRNSYRNDFSNILIIRLDNIGDVILSTSLPQILKNNFPNSRISFLVSHKNRELLVDNHNIDKILSYDAPWFNRNKKSLFLNNNFFKLIHKLKEQNFDLAIDLRGDLRHILIMALAGIKYKIGYGITGGSFLLTKIVKYIPGQHQIKYNLDLLNSLNLKIKESDLLPQIFIGEKEKKWAKEFLSGSENYKKIAIHLDAGYQSKKWPMRKCVELIKQLSQNKNNKLFILGIPSKFNNELISNLKDVEIVNLIDKTSLLKMAALLENIDLFITTDSGPAHIAGAVGTKTIVLFSGTNDPKEWAPLGKNIKIIGKTVDCSPCEREDCANNKCMNLITVNEVLDCAQELIGETH